MSRKLAMQEYGNQLVMDLQVYLRSLHTHQANNAIVSRARDALHKTLEDHFSKEPQGTLQVQLLPEETFINNTLLPISMQDFGRIKELTHQLRGMGVGEVVFDSSVTAEGLSEFAQAVYRGMHSRQKMDPRTFAGIQALELEYSASGSSERDAHQVVVWLFSGLLDGLEGLRDLVAEEHIPTMAPFMRHMRLLVDLTAERNTVIRHLCLARREGGATDDVIHRVACRTVLAVQVGHANGLDRAALMSLGLASILDLVTEGTEPDQLLTTLAPYVTLSDLAPRVMMMLRELELVRRGRRAGRHGQLLHLTEELVSTIHGESPATLEDVHSQLGWAGGIDVAVLDAVLEWLGEAPLGAIVHSRSMGEVLLLDHGEDGETLRGREVFDDGLGEVRVIRDIQEDKPIVFSSRIDFAYEDQEEESWS
jgi:hypothetical protein